MFRYIALDLKEEKVGGNSTQGHNSKSAFPVDSRRQSRVEDTQKNHGLYAWGIPYFSPQPNSLHFPFLEWNLHRMTLYHLFTFITDARPQACWNIAQHVQLKEWFWVQNGLQQRYALRINGNAAQTYCQHSLIINLMSSLMKMTGLHRLMTFLFRLKWVQCGIGAGGW